ncbi:phosphate acyltransferase [Synoicihabitans lomoniglobus]|uniref:Phosphate acyltransferase n=1 Tax=Synoicihabitans lomoniglobus TaxID=2909285 RepID=A0AAF0I3Y9_9BACT|nr:phosphate acetyltransferase [Opitutaceae bacterium LMO-M01]WED66195.1 phosphate acyltransferase [Opitutaceae bacterium LMO-M01]
MPLLDRLTAKLQRHPKRIVFPEGADPRILQAARQWVTRRLGVPILLGDRTELKRLATQLDINTKGMRLLDPARSDDVDTFATALHQLRAHKGLTLDEAREALRENSTYATMMLQAAQADALVGGATQSAASALRPLFQIIPRLPGVHTASSLMILDFDEKQIGSGGSLFMADCGVIPHPTAEQLADIAISTGIIASHLTNTKPHIAMLSFASRDTSADPSVLKMRQATQLAREQANAANLDFEIDGEMQVDAALDAYVAGAKRIESPVAGRANVLIFPDLNSGNIGFKLVQHIAGANSYGQIVTGLSKPAAEISRGSSAHDVFGAAVVCGVQAIDRDLLFGSHDAI